ncbi:hypothetical protein PHLCEN_2v10760 [Hermanssonia centrifuga]|uniref:Uncharacterized protein n=1 Tax=Hermanssonia centrifuga TaxID=98765 RepID=A0A2R6NM53_9APHY|nr:hypothetical protein PHLCEN_2v10760 [Hermanssonia centrifuga]
MTVVEAAIMGPTPYLLILATRSWVIASVQVPRKLSAGNLVRLFYLFSRFVFGSIPQETSLGRRRLLELGF